MLKFEAAPVRAVVPSVPQTSTDLSDTVIWARFGPLVSEAVPLATVKELLSPPTAYVGITAQRGLGRTARGPTAIVARMSLRSESLRLGAFFISVIKRFVTRLRLSVRR